MAVSDFYNNQIREIYASKAEMLELKEVGGLWGFVVVKYFLVHCSTLIIGFVLNLKVVQDRA